MSGEPVDVVVAYSPCAGQVECVTLSLPAGTVQGLPAGLQVVGARDRDAALLALGRWLEAGPRPA